MTHWLFSSITDPLLYTYSWTCTILRHGPSLYISQPWASLRPQIWLGYYPVPRTPLYPPSLVAILDSSSNPHVWVFFGTLSHSRRHLLVWPYPLFSITYFSLERQASLYLRPVLVQILRPHLGCGPLVVITMLPCKGDHWIHSGSLSITAVSTGNALCITWTLPQWTFTQVEPSKPSGAFHQVRSEALGMLRADLYIGDSVSKYSTGEWVIRWVRV
jgi:hypothetical protein